MYKALAYARYSSDTQREESIEAQLSAIREYAAHHDIIIEKEYIDRGISGRGAEDRQAFLDMVSDARKGDVSLVLVHKSNRFARNREDSAIYKHKLKKWGVQVKAVAQDYGEGSHVVLMEAIMEGLDEFYSLELAAETMKGLMVNAGKCLYNGGHVLYGYRVKDRKYEIDPREAAVVRDIFTKVAGGWSYIEILRYLDEKGIKTRKGIPFGKNSLHDILRNERYTGIYIFNEKPSRHPVTGQRSSRYKNSEDKIVKIPGGMPQIVPREIWEKVQERMDTRKVASTARKRRYLLTGFIKCGVCGSSYIGSTSVNTSGEWSYYRCSKKTNSKTCHNKNISARIENEVIEQISAMLNSVDCERLAAGLSERYSEQQGRQDDEKKGVEAELSETIKKTDRLIEFVEEGKATDSIRHKIEEYDETIKKLRRRLNTLASPQKKITPEMVRGYVSTLELKDKTVEEQRAVFTRLGLLIEVQPDMTNIDLGGIGGGLTNQSVASPTPQIIKYFDGILE